MGALGGLLGLGGGQSGTGIGGPQQAQIQAPVSQDQINNSYDQNQQALQQQQSLLAALQGAGGIQNQSNVYNQLQGVANGTGPNPAQAMLAQATGANVANQASLMAGQRGANANTGLIARQAALQGAGTQQQGVGQAATMQANQSLNALNQMGGIANTQAANQVGATNAYTGAQQANYGNLSNAMAAQNQARVASQSSVNAANAGMANTQLQGQQGLIGGLMNALGAGAKSAGGAGGAAHGGQIMADGGVAGPQSSFGQFLTSVQAPVAAPIAMPSFSGENLGAQRLQAGLSSLGSSSGKPSGPGAGGTPTSFGGKMSGVPEATGGMVDVVLSPGEEVVSPQNVQAAAVGGQVKAETVPGKAKVGGDSYKNDTYETKLPPGSIVVPRSRLGDPARFVRETLAKRRNKK